MKPKRRVSLSKPLVCGLLNESDLKEFGSKEEEKKMHQLTDAHASALLRGGRGGTAMEESREREQQ